jgi:hypothetical protein
MHRFALIAACAASLLSVPGIIAQDSPPVCEQPVPGAAGANLVSGIKAVPRQQSVDIEVTAGPNPSVKYERLIMPDRLAVDLDGATITTTQNRVLVDAGGILGLRVSQFRTNPPVVRVVADLAEPKRFRIFPCSGRVVIRIFAAKAVSKVASSPVEMAAVKEPAATPAPLTSVPKRPVASPSSVVRPLTPPPDLHPSRNDIRYDHGLLSINAENVSLASAIIGVGRALQANIEMPSGSGQEKIFSSIGPAPPEQAIEALLTGSSLNYIFVEGHEPGQKMTLVLSARNSASGQPLVQPAAPVQAIAPPSPNQQEGAEELPDAVPMPDQPEPGVPEPSPEIPEQPQQQEPEPQRNEGVIQPQENTAPPDHGQPLPQQDQQFPPQSQPEQQDPGRNPPP